MEKNEFMHKAIGIWVNLCRFALALVFIFSGFVKSVDPLGTCYKIEDYLAAFGWTGIVPAFIPLPASILLAIVEFTLGIYFLFGIRRRISTLLILLIMLFMTPLTLYLAIEDPVSDCGCFGDAVILSNWATFWKNVALLVAALSVFKWGNRIIRLISEKSQWLVSVYTLAFITGIAIYSLHYLPILDFRPYKTGTNIREGMEIPAGAKPNVYESVFILEKNGVKKEFTLENYPDSTWTFVDSRTVLKEKGYEPPIHDFSITRADDGEDITEEVLNDSNYTFLLIAHQIDKASDSNIDLINEIYDYSVDNRYKFYCLTSSAGESIHGWMGRTGAEYPFCYADDTTLKTIIRSNPGLVLLKDGTVYRKWSHNNLPDEYMLNGRLENIELGQCDEKSKARTIANVTLGFFFPLAGFIGIDLLLIRRKEKKKREAQAGGRDTGTI